MILLDILGIIGKRFRLKISKW